MLTIDVARKVVKIARKQVDMTAAEKSTRDALIQTQTAAVFEQAVQAKLTAIAARDYSKWERRKSAGPRVPPPSVSCLLHAP